MAKSQTAGYEESLQQYFQEISRYPLLSSEEEIELSKKVLQGDQGAREKLIRSNLRLVVRIAKSFSGCGIALLDLIQEGNMGLMVAAKKFDWKKGVRFSTYAAWWIKQGILRSISNKKRMIRIPHRKEEALLRIERYIAQFSSDYGRDPSTEEIAQATGLSKKEVSKILNIIFNVQSLDQEITEDGSTLIDSIEDTRYDPYLVIDQEATKDEVDQLLKVLAEKEKQILMYRFAFYDGKKYTLKTISEKLGISAETVRQIEIKAIYKLRQQSQQLGLAG